MVESRKVARYLINGELFCGECAENIGGSFIEKKRFVEYTRYCAGCDPRSCMEILADELKQKKHKT